MLRDNIALAIYRSRSTDYIYRRRVTSAAAVSCDHGSGYRAVKLHDEVIDAALVNVGRTANLNDSELATGHKLIELRVTNVQDILRLFGLIESTLQLRRLFCTHSQSSPADRDERSRRR
jgi:hypothetical protein